MHREKVRREFLALAHRITEGVHAVGLALTMVFVASLLITRYPEWSHFIKTPLVALDIALVVLLTLGFAIRKLGFRPGSTTWKQPVTREQMTSLRRWFAGEKDNDKEAEFYV